MVCLRRAPTGLGVLGVLMVALAGCVPDPLDPSAVGVPSIGPDATSDGALGDGARGDGALGDGALGDGAPRSDGGRDGGRTSDGGAAPAAETPALTDLAAMPLLGRLPPGTPAVVALAPPTTWATQLEIGTLVDATGRWGEALRDGAREMFGYDLTDPTHWARLWVDADRPITAALLEVDPPTIALGARLTDPIAARTLIYAVHALHHPLREVEVDDATVIGRLDGQGPVFAFEGDEAWVVVGEGLMRGEAFHLAVSLARPTARLGEQAPIRAALAELGTPRSAVAVINTPALVQRGLRTAFDDPEIDALREAEAFARRFDEFPRANRLMTDRLRHQTMNLVTGQRRVAAEVMRAAFFPFGPTAIGLTLDDGLTLEAVQRITPGTLPATTLRAGAATRLTHAFGGDPALGATISFDPEVASALARGLVLIANRGEIAQFEAEMRARTGVDVRRDLLQTARGIIDVVVDIDPDRFDEPASLLEALHRIGVLVRWGVDTELDQEDAESDAAKVTRTLERIQKGFDWVESAGEGRFAIDLPPVPRIWLQVGRDAVWASFDPTVLARLSTDQLTLIDEAPIDEAPAALTVDIDPAAFGPALEALVPGPPTRSIDPAAFDPDAAPIADGGSDADLDAGVEPPADAEPPPDAAERTPTPPEPELIASPGGRFAIERRRGRTIAAAVSAIELRGTPEREQFTLRLRITPGPDGLTGAAARIIEASVTNPDESRGKKVEIGARTMHSR